MWRLGVQPCKNGRRVHILIIGLMPETLKKRSSANQFDTPGLERSSVWSASHTGARSPPSAASAGLRSWQPVQTPGLGTLWLQSLHRFGDSLAPPPWSVPGYGQSPPFTPANQVALMLR